MDLPEISYTLAGLCYSFVTGRLPGKRDRSPPAEGAAAESMPTQRQLHDALTSVQEGQKTGQIVVLAKEGSRSRAGRGW